MSRHCAMITTLLLLSIAACPVDARVAVLLDIDGPIGPATSDYLQHGLIQARQENAALVILRMDTPGGLDHAMRTIVRNIIASPVPVVTYVAPGGARAASAGTYVLYASHIAAMAPGTNLGAATPVQIGGAPNPSRSTQRDNDKKSANRPGDAMERKMVNDAVAYIRGLAQLRGRNADWAELAVKEAASIPVHEALHQGIIDLIAEDIPGLLAQLDGRKVKLQKSEQILQTQHIVVQRLAPDWRNRWLSILTNPSVAYILMLIGIYGLFFEFVNPGFILPGVTGAIALMCALYALEVLPINYAGLGLVLLGISFLVGEVLAPSGVLGIGGVTAFVAGSLMLFDTDVDNGAYVISKVLVLGFAVLSAAFLISVVSMVLKVRARPVVSGREQLIGANGMVMEDFTGLGRIRIHGEIWRASCDTPLLRGQQIRVTDIQALTLIVQPLTE